MKNGYILVVDDEPLTRHSLYEILKFEGYKVDTAKDGKEALQLVEKYSPDIVIADLKLPDINGIELLRRIKSITKEIQVVLITGYGSIETAVEAMKEGAFDYITKPIVDSEIKMIIEKILNQKRLLEENRLLKEKLSATVRTHFHNIIGEDEKMQNIYRLIEAIAGTRATVLISGESGTGKRLVAYAIHHSDPTRAKRPFVEVSCGALPETLLESELFGHVKGAFTGAIKDRQGRFELAEGGTIFLDEIDTFTPHLQVKLLRVLQTGEFERVGETQTRKVNIRVIAATNRNLKELIKKGVFREDLYYRLNVIPIHLPPLRERKGDIPLLVDHFLKQRSNFLNKKVTKISNEAIDALLSYDWPGNVRELENVIERAIILTKGETITLNELPEYFLPHPPSPTTTSPFVISSSPLEEGKSFKEALQGAEAQIIQKVLTQTKGNRKKAAQILGVNRTTLYNKMKKYGLLEK